jgi:hypothetical protein
MCTWRRQLPSFLEHLTDLLSLKMEDFVSRITHASDTIHHQQQHHHHHHHREETRWKLPEKWK